MLPLGYNSLAEHEMKVLYRAWEGQLFVQNQRVCDLVLRSPFQSSIPAQLPAKLEFKYIVRISELREKLPQAAFKKTSYFNDEVCCQQLSFRLYHVEILEGSDLKDQLIGSMKEKNVALVKYLNDRGVLLFLTSSVLAKEKDAEADDLGSLQALFLFPSPGPKRLTATDWKREEGRSEAPQQLPLILPLLRQALAGAAKNPNLKLSPASAVVKRHMEELANPDRSSAPNCDDAAGPPSTSTLPSETPQGGPVDYTRSLSAFSNLALYLSDPESYALEVSSAAACLKAPSRLSDGSGGLNLDPSPSDGAGRAVGPGEAPFGGHGPRRAAAPKSSPSGERSLPWTKRKSSRILGASSKKKWSPLKMYCLLESSKKKTKEKEKRKKKKKKKKKKLPKEAMTSDAPLAKDPGSPSDPKKPTLKLKNIQNPLRRKRGAEVLSAEFIQGPRGASLEGAAGSSAGPATEEKKPRLNVAAKVKNVDKMDAKGAAPRKNLHGVCSETQRTEAASVEKDAATPDAHRMPSGGEVCDSHALNLLADLALSSCNSPLDGNNRRDFGRFRPSREHRLPRGKFLLKPSDHEYHRATKKRKGAFLPGQASRSSLWPAKETGRDKDRSAVHPVEKRQARTNLAKTSLALPHETGDLSDSSVIISLEHSYASPVAETPQKGTPPSPNSRNGLKEEKPGPLVGKVLPFQHQQNSCQPGKPVSNPLPPARSTVLAARLREDFSTSRQVTSRDKTVQVSFQWEAKYVFDLDSKYTNNSLEKTVIRAVHGPWDESLSDDLEEMRLILHMWMALFYSRPIKALTVRKVVEHSNPAKYVSLNSLVEPLEPLDDEGGACAVEKRPLGSLPEAVRIPAGGGQGGPVSPSEKLLPENELSSSDSLEDESPLATLEEGKDLLEKEGLSPRPPLKSVDEVVEAEPEEQTSLPPVLPVENPPGFEARLNPPIGQTQTDGSQEFKLVGSSQEDASLRTGPPEGSRNQQPIASPEVAVSVTNRGTDVVGSSSEEGEKDHLPTGGPNPGTSKTAGLKADVKSGEPPDPGSQVQNQPRLRMDEREGGSVDLKSIDLTVSKSKDVDMEIRDMDLVSEDEDDPVESGVKGREEADGMSDDDTSSRQGPLLSRASSPDASTGHQVEFPDVQEAASSTSVSPNQMELMDKVPQQEISFHPMTVEEKMVGSTSSSLSPNQMELMDKVPQQEISFHPMTVEEKMVGSTSSSVSPNQMELMEKVPQQEISFHPMTVEEKMVGSTSSSVSPNEMELMDKVPQQEISFHPVTVEEEMVGSTSTSVSPNEMELMDKVPQQEISFHPMTVEEKMVGSTSSSVSPNQMELMEKVPEQEISFHPMTVEEKMVGSTSSSVSPNQMELMEKVPQQEIMFHPMIVEEKMVGSTSSSVSPNQMELMEKVPEQEISFHPMTVEEKMVGSTSSSVSPNQMELMEKVPQREIMFHPMTVEEKMVGSTSSSVSPNQMELMEKVPQQEISFHPMTVEEEMVGSTSSSVSSNQMMDKVPQQEISFHPMTVEEKMVGSTSSSVPPNQMELMDKVPQQISFHPMTVEEEMVGSTSSSVSPNQMELMDMVPQQETSLHPMTVVEKMMGSATDPTSPKQTDEVDEIDEAISADSTSSEASGDFPNDRATPDGPLQNPQEPMESPRVPHQVDVIDLSSVSREGHGIHLSCLPLWPVHQRASDEEPPRIQSCLENPLYGIFENPMGLIEDISQDSTDLADSAAHVCEPNDNLCVNLVPNVTSTQQELVENQESSVAFAQRLPLAKEMDLVESPEGDHRASPPHQDDSGAKLDFLEESSIPQEKDVIHPADEDLGRVNERRLAESDVGTQEEQTIGQGEKIPVDSQPAKEDLSLELHDAEPETSFERETCLDQENIGDPSAKDAVVAVPEDSIEKPPVTMTAVAEEVHVLMNEVVDAVCAVVAQSEETPARKSLGWIDSAMLECVTPPGSDDEGCPTDHHSQADVKWSEEGSEETPSFDDQEEDLQARVEGRRELCSLSNENTTSDLGDVSEKAELQGNEATSAASGIFSTCGISQAELDTTSPKSRCSWLETTESPGDYSAKVDDYDMSTVEKVGQTEASPEEPICDREDCSRGEDVEDLSFVPAKCQEDSLAEGPSSLVDRVSNEAPEDGEEEAQEEAKGCLGSLEDPLADERTQRPTSSSGMDTDLEDESLAVDGGQDPCVDWYPARKSESLYQPRSKASPRIESELTRSSTPASETCKDGGWVSSEASPKTSDARSMEHNVPFGLTKDDRSILPSPDVDQKPESFKDYINFSVTKKHKEKSRTFHMFSKEHNPFSRDLGPIHSWTRNWGFLSDPIQNILDVESLKFHCRIQELLKKSQRSTSRVLPSKKVPPRGIAAGLPPRTVSKGTIARFPTRSQSPLLVTVVNPDPRTVDLYDDIYGPFPASLDPFVQAAAPRSQDGLGLKYPFPSLHLQRLTYHKLNSFSRDISSVLEGFAEFSRAMTLERARTGSLERDSATATSGKADELRYPPRPPMPLVYEDLLADLRHALHFQLKNVAQEACRKPFSFYLMETDDDPFFGRVKNLLKKAGHSAVDVVQFFKGNDLETDNVLVIVRNEDIYLHIHKIPSLLRLKRCPTVTFAGVDSPQDALDHTYQELFHSGGFVVSDDNVLQGMTVGELKDVIKTLEKLNGHGRWKWFLHYRESKKLKEDARGDPAAHTKESVLKSCQVANMTEVLHYHKCDSGSCSRFERFNCLLNLQIQHITRRFGVFLTENASANREALEDKGLFGLNITEFIATAQDMVAPFGSGFW